MDTINHRIDLIKLLPKNPVTVELGVAEGNFSLDILREWMPRKHYLVDNWGPVSGITGDGTNEQQWHDKNYSSTLHKIREYQHIEILRGITWEMASKVPYGSIDLVYIDACHSYECVRKDIEGWISRIKIGGIMAFHDYLSPDYRVKQAVDNFCEEMNYKINIIPELKNEDAGAWFKIDK